MSSSNGISACRCYHLLAATAIAMGTLILLYAAEPCHARRDLADKPNIIIFLTDDQDTELGSMQYMPKANRVFEQGGAKFLNAFASSPICCPSRSTILTGLYTHNHNVYTNNDNCSSTQWQRKFEPRSFGKYLNDAGYRTGYFGKYLNEYNGTYTPPGWHEWLGLVKNSAFYNYTVSFNGRLIRHGDNYHADYLTDLIANDSVTFLKQSKQYYPSRPVAMVLSVPAPHGPEDAAPQYQKMFLNSTTHRTPNWNYAPNPDKVWLLQVTGKMEPIQVAFTDQLQAKRLQTLQSVDDAVEKMYNELRNLGELENTYMIYMSDHGYHLGQFGLPKGKSLPYEFDIRIPFYIRGPGIQRGLKVRNIMGTVDVAPTVLDLANISVPDDMDGRSVKPLLNIPDENGEISEASSFKKRTWRDTYLLQRGKVTRKRQDTYDVTMDQLPIYFTRDGQIEDKCTKPKYQSPCKPGQRVECYQDSRNRMRLRKCKTLRCDCPGAVGHSNSSGGGGGSVSSGSSRSSYSKQYQQLVGGSTRFAAALTVASSDGISSSSSRAELRAAGPTATRAQARRSGSGGRSSGIRAHSRSSSAQQRPTSVAASLRRQLMQLRQQQRQLEPQHYSGSGTADYLQRSLEAHSLRLRRAAAEGDEQAFSLQEGTFMQRCQIVNTTVKCSLVEEYINIKEWKRQKQALELLIQESKDHLEKLKALRKSFLVQYDTAKHRMPQGGPSISQWQGQITFTTSIGEQSIGGDGVTVTPAAPVDIGCTCQEVDVEDEEDSAGSDGMQPHSNETVRVVDEDENADEEPEDDDSTIPVFTTVASYAEEQLQRKETTRRSRNDRKCTGSGCARRPGVQKPKESRRNDPNCRVEGVECHVMDNNHWKVEPRWRLGPFCYCINAVNNTLWCLRTINESHNFLYCEFINGFIEYYDLNKDPWQFRNAVFDLPHGVLQQLHLILNKMRNCKGSRECHYRYRGDHTSSAATLYAASAGAGSP